MIGMGNGVGERYAIAMDCGCVNTYVYDAELRVFILADIMDCGRH